MSSEERLSTGTTTVGIMCKDAVILAADRRATAGSLIVDKNVDKVVPISDRVMVTTSGSVSDIQLLVNFMKAELRLKRIRSGRETSVKEAAHLLSSWVYNIMRSQYGIAHFVLGGYDTTQGLYDIYPDGSLTKITDFVASGSGSIVAYGLLEDAYKPNMSVDEAVKLAVRAVNAAMQRDSASGNGISVYVIDKHGCRQEVLKSASMSVL